MLGALSVISFYSLGLSLPLAFVLAVAAVTVLGLAFERLAIRPAREATPISLIIITVGGGVLLKGLAMLLWGKDAYTLPPFSGQKPLMLAGATILPQSLWIIGLTLLLVAGPGDFSPPHPVGKSHAGRLFQSGSSPAGGYPGKPDGAVFLRSQRRLRRRGRGHDRPHYHGRLRHGHHAGAERILRRGNWRSGEHFRGGPGRNGPGHRRSLYQRYAVFRYRDAVAFLILLLVLFFRPQGLIGLRSTRSS